ncbi:MAG: ABC transporter permease [Lentimicrobiaceae bacterium]|nr:ABC transporter permease [Lentimicrobiaceae bacterium]
MIEFLSEIANTLKRNKLRTFLTGFSIAWGIFILIVLLAAGNGLKNGVMSNFADETINKLNLRAYWTSKPYKGYSAGREIYMDYTDSVLMAHSFTEVKGVYPTYQLGGKTLHNGKKHSKTLIEAVVPEYFNLEKLNFLYGRSFNQLDMNEKRKIIIISTEDANLLFGKEDVVGERVVVDNIVFQVAGVYKKNRMSWKTDCCIPLTTALSIYYTKDRLTEIICTLDGLTTLEENEAFTKMLRMRLSRKHQYDPEDYLAIHISNSLQSYLQNLRMFSALSMLLWIIGLGTLISGVVGVSNIMLVTVRERTKELGIRKALGAKPASIIRLIISEALVVMALFGYLGMILGILLTKGLGIVMAAAMAQGGEDMPTMFLNPTVDLHIALGATLVLIVAGVLAGYFPARRAVAVKPIEALRYE